jgi:hypothetical protein
MPVQMNLKIGDLGRPAIASKGTRESPRSAPVATTAAIARILLFMRVFVTAPFRLFVTGVIQLHLQLRQAATVMEVTSIVKA